MKKEIALDLRLSRNRSGLSGRDLAHLLGCNKERISKLECGNARVTPDELIALSIIYGQSLNSFVSVTNQFIRILKERLATMPPEPVNWKRKREARLTTLNELSHRLQTVTDNSHEA